MCTTIIFGTSQSNVWWVYIFGINFYEKIINVDINSLFLYREILNFNEKYALNKKYASREIFSFKNFIYEEKCGIFTQSEKV